MINKLTILIPAYKSCDLLIRHLDFISKNIKVLIVDNSNDKILKKKIEKKYKNTKVILKKNIGYGRAINAGAKLVKSKFFL